MLTMSSPVVTTIKTDRRQLEYDVRNLAGWLSDVPNQPVSLELRVEEGNVMFTVRNRSGGHLATCDISSHHHLHSDSGTTV